jgi:hypothetical protein
MAGSRSTLATSLNECGNTVILECILQLSRKISLCRQMGNEEAKHTGSPERWIDTGLRPLFNWLEVRTAIKVTSISGQTILSLHLSGNRR